MIRICQIIAGALWVLFTVVWLVAATGAKKNIIHRSWWMRLPARLAVAAIIAFVLLRVSRAGVFASGIASSLTSPGAALAGVFLCCGGITCAVWARAVIGANWGMPMTFKQNHRLVTTGPYAYVRHPIYAGILVAMLGSVLVLSLWWLVILIANAVQFIYAAKKEEQLMLRNFPDEYAPYMSRTWMLIPFLY